MGIHPYQYQEMLARVERNKLRGAVTREAAEIISERSERDLHDKILAECARRGFIAIHSRMDRPTTNNVGLADFVILADHGRTLLVECKSRTGKLTTEQLAFKMLAERLGHTVHVCRSMSEFLTVIES